MAREFAKKFYKSPEWIKQRNYMMNKQDHLCQECLSKGEYTPAEEVHHQIFLRPSNINDPMIALDENNLVCLCRNCHMEIHRRSAERAKQSNHRYTSNGYFFNSIGEIEEQKVYIVHGSPGSGKSTYVREHMKRGDLVVDLDLIKQAISMYSREEVVDDLLDTAIAIRDLLYQKIKQRDVCAESIWVIASLPTRKQRRELAEQLQAELIHVEATVEECVERILKDVERKDKEFQVRLIDKYFGYYQK